MNGMCIGVKMVGMKHMFARCLKCMFIIIIISYEGKLNKVSNKCLFVCVFAKSVGQVCFLFCDDILSVANHDVV